ncbi:hypothetical protein ACXR2U_02190 [Jatrophihabitans sp. YIM 134969]
MTSRPEIVCLCGSARFAAELAAVNRELTLAGAIVVAPAFAADAAGRDAAEALSDAQRRALGELHLRKIELADRVVVVDPGGYLGDAVRREIAHARAAGKPVTFTEPV